MRKSNKTVSELINMEFYSVDFDTELQFKSEAECAYTDSTGHIHPVKTDSFTEEEIRFAMEVNRTSYLKSIKIMLMFLTGVVAIGLIGTIIAIIQLL